MEAIQQAVKACVSRLQKAIEEGGFQDPNAAAELLQQIEALEASNQWPKGAWAGLMEDQVCAASAAVQALRRFGRQWVPAGTGPIIGHRMACWQQQQRGAGGLVVFGNWMRASIGNIT